jgi:mono/diheme cytochrome c family protein
VFVSVGCASCHTLTAGGKPLESKLAAVPLAKLRPERGCLGTVPVAGTPHYALSGAQRTALAAAVKALPSPAAAPTAREVIARSMTALNCYACHQRDKVGGVEEGLNPFFTTAEREMGDEGRLPPALNGVGAKLTAAYLKKVLADGGHDRPYMHTRMPGFGAANTAALVTAFQAVDTMPPVPVPVFSGTLPRVKADGRHMVGAIGSSPLGCVKCHTFAGHKSEGVQGIDMTLMPQRLRRDWFHRYVLDPQKFRPGTRMPSSWPGGVSFLPDIQGGDTAKQVEAIWVYLSDGKAALVPLGLKKQYIPLIPEKEAILYRNFVTGAGPRAIAVGYPEKAHLAFDANEMRLAEIWQGAFMDAARHWTGRGEGFEPPLGDNVLQPQSGVAFAVLGGDKDAWPARPAREIGYKFLGYRLTPDGRPTFLYSYAGVRVEDFPTAVAGKPAASIRRTLTLSAERPVERLWFRAAVGDKIEAAGDGWYRVNGEWRVRIESAAPAVLRRSGGKQELLVPVRFGDGRAKIVQEIVW